MLSMLLQRGVDPNASDRRAHDDSYGTIFARVCDSGELEAIRYMLEAGADPNLTNAIGTTPLARAAERDEEAAVSLLLEYGADVNVRDAYGQSPLDCCLPDSASRTLIVPHDQLGPTPPHTRAQVVTLLERVAVALEWEAPKGCTETEIDDLEVRAGIPLPKAYKEYLLLLGKDEVWSENVASLPYREGYVRNRGAGTEAPEPFVIGSAWMSSDYAIIPDGHSDDMPVHRDIGSYPEREWRKVADSIWDLIHECLVEKVRLEKVEVAVFPEFRPVKTRGNL